MEVMPRRAWWLRQEEVYAAAAGRPGDAAITFAAPRTQCVPFGGRQSRSQCASRPRSPTRANGATAESAEAENCGRAAVGCGFRHRHAPQLLFVDGA